VVFIGGGWGPWRRRRRVNPFDPYNQDPYGPPPPGYGYPPPRYGYQRGFRRVGYGGGGSCLRDMLLVEGGCCLAEALGCGPQLLLATPALIRARWRGGRRETERGLHSTPTADRASPLLISLVGYYQREVSPRRPPCCRFSPTCSHYAVEALQRHGSLRGTLLTARRLLRCRPGAASGVDPVPR
jgi:putative membrane protein insertion efficiency factor